MPNMAVRTANSAGDPESSSDKTMALKVSTDSTSTEFMVTTPDTAEVSEIDASSYSPPVQPVEAVVLHSSPMHNMAALQFDGAESNSSTEPPVHQANRIQDNITNNVNENVYVTVNVNVPNNVTVNVNVTNNVTRGGLSDAASNLTVNVVIPRRCSH